LGSAGPQPVAVGVGLNPGNTPIPTCYPAKFGSCRSNGASIMKDIHLKKLSPHISTSKVSQGHWNHAEQPNWLHINVP